MPENARTTWIVLRRIFSKPVAAEWESDVFRGHGLCVEVEHRTVEFRIAVIVGESEIATLTGCDGLGDGLAIVRGGRDIVLHFVNLISVVERHAAIEAVAVCGETKRLPVAMIGAVDHLGMVDAAAIGDDGTDGDTCHLAQINAAVNILMQDADGVVGGNLLGDAVECPSLTIERTHVNAVDTIARIGSLDGLDVRTVPCFCRHAVGSHLREAWL